MFNNSNSTTENTMPGSMPGAMPQEESNTQLQQQNSTNTSVGNNASSLNKDQNSNFIPTQDGHRTLLSHHKGLGKQTLDHNSPRAAGATGADITGHNVNPIHHDSPHLNTNPLHNNSTHSSVTSQDGKDHHYGRDAALGAGAAGLAGHAYKEHQKDNATHSGANPLHHGSPQSGVNPLHHESTHSNANPLHNDATHPSVTSQDGKDHHYARDAALGAGAAGLAGHAYNEHQKDNTTHSTSANPLHHGSPQSDVNPLHESTHSNANPLHKDSTHSSVTSQDGKDHHYARDAALGAGAAGLAGHAYKEHQKDNATHSGVNPLHHGSTQSGANPLHHESIHSNANPLHNDSTHPSVTSQDGKDHHYARDAALGAGAAGLAGHAYNEHQKDNTTHSTSANPLHHGSPQSDVNPLHESTHSNANPLHKDSTHSSVTSQDGKDHHYARDAALGAGAAGLTGHAYKEHQKDNTTHSGANPLHHESTHSNANPLHNDSTRPSVTSQDGKDHHYARDAALGAGAAGLAGHAYKEHQKDNATHSGVNPLHHGSTQSGANPLHHESIHSNANPLHNDSTHPSVTSQDGKDHHYARDAALGAGAAGLAGHAYNEHQKDNTTHSTSANPLHHGSTQSGVNPLHHESTHSNANPLHNDSTHPSVTSQDGKDHHYARDAALGAGAAGLAGHAYKEHQKDNATHSGVNPLHHGSTQSGANPLHHESIHSNANPLHNDSTHPSVTSQDGKDHHYARDAALGAGAAGLAGHAYKEHQKDNTTHSSANPLQHGSTQSGANPLHHESTHSSTNPLHNDATHPSVTPQDGKDHHYARDAALGAGAVGADHKLKEHTENKRDSGILSDNSNTSVAKDTTKKKESGSKTSGGIVEEEIAYKGGLTGNQPVSHVVFEHPH